MSGKSGKPGPMSRTFDDFGEVIVSGAKDLLQLGLARDRSDKTGMLKNLEQTEENLQDLLDAVRNERARWLDG